MVVAKSWPWGNHDFPIDSLWGLESQPTEPFWGRNPSVMSILFKIPIRLMVGENKVGKNNQLTIFFDKK